MGKVYLMGAGPGDPGLLTVKGKGILTYADVVIYDALVSSAILDLIPPAAERIYAGKRSGRHSRPQEEISSLLIEKAQHHAVVVRLKGGDPFLFGRGAEEMAALVAAQVDVEVIPGVSAGMAAPAYAGIPVTHRDYSSSVLFVTGHEAVGRYQPRVNWRAVAEAAETIVVYMGIYNLPSITHELLQAGKPPETPVAIICWGTTPQQTVLTTTLQELDRDDLDLHLTPPAIVVIGSVVQLHHLLPTLRSLA
ncbi:MAG: uroporphyrinogen-III C-methyltransferase [Synechococcaceae cyanobacterium SM2_3_1]|nr:uroporphyrinogen-III C-methyltransferase [Synechococcaceae cyanobacterium SM2_3_1]